MTGEEMKKRLRKKKHLAEFAKWGRRLVVKRNTSDNPEEFQDAFLLEAVEGNNCYCGGSLSDDGLNVIVELGVMSDNPDERFSKITTWLDARPDVEKWQSGPLTDLWHGYFDEIETETET